MRIGLVLPSIPGYSETFLQSKISGLQAAGHEVVVFAESKNAASNKFKVIQSPRIPSFLPNKIVTIFLGILSLTVTNPDRVLNYYKLEKRSGRKFKQIVENLYINSHILKEKLDWLHFGFATMAVRRENVANTIGAKMGASLRGYDISLYPMTHPGCYNLLWEKADKIHVISNALAQKAYENGLKSNKQVVKITPAINIKEFNRKTSNQISESPLKILTVARLKWVKGLEYTLIALSLMKKQIPDFHYTIIGEGEEYKRLVFAVYQLGLTNNVTFSGKLSHEEVRDQMANSTIYVQYSIQEGFCNSVLEAQAMGLLCVVSDAEGLPENVIHNKTGWIVPRRSPKLLADKIIEITKSPIAELDAIREYAIGRVQMEFNLESQQASFIEFFNK